jgi:hypothetical protein
MESDRGENRLLFRQTFLVCPLVDWRSVVGAVYDSVGGVKSTSCVCIGDEVVCCLFHSGCHVPRLGHMRTPEVFKSAALFVLNIHPSVHILLPQVKYRPHKLIIAW